MKCPGASRRTAPGRGSAKSVRRLRHARAPTAEPSFPRLPSSAPSPLSCWSDGPADTRALRRAESYTPKHLAERILTSKTAFESVRKQVTVSFADLKGSMELAQSHATGRLTTSARPRRLPQQVTIARLMYRVVG
jgi:hypothetical protein